MFLDLLAFGGLWNHMQPKELFAVYTNLVTGLDRGFYKICVFLSPGKTDCASLLSATWGKCKTAVVLFYHGRQKRKGLRHYLSHLSHLSLFHSKISWHFQMLWKNNTILGKILDIPSSSWCVKQFQQESLNIRCFHTNIVPRSLPAPSLAVRLLRLQHFPLSFRPQQPDLQVVSLDSLERSWSKCLQTLDKGGCGLKTHSGTNASSCYF